VVEEDGEHPEQCAGLGAVVRAILVMVVVLG
jgi:hypothetical protein